MPDQFLRYPIRGQKFSYSIETRRHLLSRKTDFQQIDVYDTEAFGKVLTLDGHVQLSSLDEHAYHESLVHIPLMSLSTRKRALVGGGGDGGVLREICRWPDVEQVDMIEIDRGVIESCRETLPELSAGAFDDPRVHVRIADAFKFLKESREPYDFIVMDITDAYEEEDGELSEQLFTESFHRDIANCLAPGGFLVTQADNHIFCTYSMENLKTTLQKVFRNVGSYQAIVPSFGGFSGFVWAGNSAQVPTAHPAWPSFSLRYLNPTTYALAFENLGFALRG